jgi:hypothetical protein
MRRAVETLPAAFFDTLIWIFRAARGRSVGPVAMSGSPVPTRGGAATATRLAKVAV